MIVKVRSMREIRRLEQEHISLFGCELNPIRAYLSEEKRKELKRVSNSVWAMANRDKDRGSKRAWKRRNWERYCEKVVCECGEPVSRNNISRHKGKSNKHAIQLVSNFFVFLDDY